jgi:hypothetical protein
MPPAKKIFPRTTLATLMATATVQVVFAYKNTPTDWDFQRLPLFDGLPDEFRQRGEAAAVDLRDNRTGRAYDPEWDLGDDEYFYVSNNPPVGGNFFKKLPNFASLPEFQEKKRIRQPKAWVIVAQLDDGTIAYFGARITSSAVLNRNSKVLRVVFQNDAFDRLDETVITFGSGIDWIVWKGTMIVLHAKNFHAVFRDVPALLKVVDGHLATISQHVGIVNLSELAERIKTTPAMAVKLSRIIERADMHTLPPARLRKYGEDYGIDVAWQKGKMVFDGSVEKQWNLLRLLDEARTLGPVTGKKWDTSAKTEV